MIILFLIILALLCILFVWYNYYKKSLLNKFIKNSKSYIEKYVLNYIDNNKTNIIYHFTLYNKNGNIFDHIIIDTKEDLFRKISNKLRNPYTNYINKKIILKNKKFNIKLIEESEREVIYNSQKIKKSISDIESNIINSSYDTSEKLEDKYSNEYLDIITNTPENNSVVNMNPYSLDGKFRDEIIDKDEYNKNESQVISNDNLNSDDSIEVIYINDNL